MKMVVAQFLLLALASCLGAQAASLTPVSKVLTLLSDLQSKVAAEGEKAQKVYTELSEWCEDHSRNLGFEIKTGEAEVASLKATIEEASATGNALGSKVEELNADITTDEADLKAATTIRDKEAADFKAEAKELSEIIDTLQRAIGILEREMKSGSASMVQLRTAGSVTQALSSMVQASVLNSADAGR